MKEDLRLTPVDVHGEVAFVKASVSPNCTWGQAIAALIRTGTEYDPSFELTQEPIGAKDGNVTVIKVPFDPLIPAEESNYYVLGIGKVNSTGEVKIKT